MSISIYLYVTWYKGSSRARTIKRRNVRWPHDFFVHDWKIGQRRALSKTCLQIKNWFWCTHTFCQNDQAYEQYLFWSISVPITYVWKGVQYAWPNYEIKTFSSSRCKRALGEHSCDSIAVQNIFLSCSIWIPLKILYYLSFKWIWAIYYIFSLWTIVTFSYTV